MSYNEDILSDEVKDDDRSLKSFIALHTILRIINNLDKGNKTNKANFNEYSRYLMSNRKNIPEVVFDDYDNLLEELK